MLIWFPLPLISPPLSVLGFPSVHYSNILPSFSTDLHICMLHTQVLTSASSLQIFSLCVFQALYPCQSLCMSFALRSSPPPSHRKPFPSVFHTRRPWYEFRPIGLKIGDWLFFLGQRFISNPKITPRTIENNLTSHVTVDTLSDKKGWNMGNPHVSIKARATLWNHPMLYQRRLLLKEYQRRTWNPFMDNHSDFSGLLSVMMHQALSWAGNIWMLSLDTKCHVLV